MTSLSPQVAGWRRDTPGCEKRIHLNNAGASLMPRPVLDAVEGHLRREAELGGYEAADAAVAEIAGTYAALGELIHCAPRNVAVVENATAAFALALSSFDFKQGDAILTSRNDYISNQLMYLSLARRLGVEIMRAEDTTEGGVDPASVERMIARRRPTLVAITHIPTNSGLVQDVEAVGAVCAAAGVPYLVDACQSVGQLPVHVGRMRCDFLSATGRKFLRGPRGVGFLYVSDAALARGAQPLLVDMRGAEWTAADDYTLVDGAQRFENWEFAYALHLGLGAAARYAVEAGGEAASQRACDLAARARALLGEVPGVRVLDRGRRLGAIVTAEIRGMDARAVVARLRAAGINTSASLRAYAVIDMDDKRAGSAVRLSPHYYNTDDEIGRAVEAIREIAGGRS
ncbi:MAG TPA: aminotransferase class V-fold PLP-dependent enzyme [Gemmatimonadales bacterium]|nr:aminotransferase class V-fold PLP-dependent enzyme [Gemmatimonadales bacterium]